MLIPVKYHSKTYPKHIKPEIDEIAAHLDVTSISPTRKFSLHTEYSFGARGLSSSILSHFHILRKANKSGVSRKLGAIQTFNL
jgi:hypothetical protein